MEGVGKQATELPSLIAEWGISHTTLEEVFMRITGKKEKPNSITI